MSDKDDTKKDEKSFKGFGVRYIQASLMFLCFTFIYSMRTVMGIAIVAMTDKESTLSVPIFDWSKPVKDTILSSFFWGYMSAQIPAGYIAHKYGAKFLLCFALFGNSSIAFVIPYVAQYAGWKMLCVCRVFQGLSQGVVVPSLHTLIGKWSPVNERSRMVALVYGGAQSGTIVGLTVSGYIASSSYGWPAIFYFSGIVCFITGAFWLCIGADSPEVHKTITMEEKLMIQSSIGHKPDQKPIKTPWVKIFTSMPVLAMMTAHVGSSWIQIMIITELPSYFSKAMHVDIKSNGLLSALPQLSMWGCSFIYSFIIDYLVKNELMSTTVLRKVANTMAMWGASLCMVGISFLSSGSVMLAEILMIVALGLKSGIASGFQVNPIDISPNFAGTLIGISNCFSNAIALLAPLSAAYFVDDENDITQWRNVFYLTAGIAFFTNMVFLCFGSAKKAPWNDPEDFQDGKITEMLPMVEKGTKGVAEKNTN